MRFRVSAVQDEGTPEGLTEARHWLEEWLNQVLGDGDFGCPNGCIMLVVFATDSLLKAPPASRAFNLNDTEPTLALNVSLPPALLGHAEHSRHKAILCAKVVQELPEKPLRNLSGRDYPRLRKALVASIEPFANDGA